MSEEDTTRAGSGGSGSGSGGGSGGVGGAGGDEIAEADQVMEDMISQGQGWGAIWQLPTLVASMALFGYGVSVAVDDGKPNDFNGAYVEVREYMGIGKYDQAQLKVREIQPFVPEAEIKDQINYHILAGDLIYDIQYNEENDNPKNYMKVIEHYLRAEELAKKHKVSGFEFDQKQLERWVEMYVALNQDEKALAFIDKEAVDYRGLELAIRYGVLRKIIERMAMRKHADQEKLFDLVNQFREEVVSEVDVVKRMEQEIWAHRFIAEMQLALKDYKRVVNNMVIAIGDYQGAGVGNKKVRGNLHLLAPLNIMLARAYQGLGRDEDEKNYTRAVAKYEEARKLLNGKKLKENELHSEILLGLGQIELARKQDDESQVAADYFEQAVSDYQGTRAYYAALIGWGDALSRLNRHEDALEKLNRASSGLMGLKRKQKEDEGLLIATVGNRHQAMFDRNKYKDALDYMEVLEIVYGMNRPKEYLKKLADTHFAFANAQVERAGQVLASKKILSADEEKSRRLANREAAKHFEMAGDHYRDYGNAVGRANESLYAQSLWKAATAYDSAEAWQKAIVVYSQYVQDTEVKDPKRHEAQFHIGMAYHADGEHEMAVERFEDILSASEAVDSQWGDQSWVPQARSYRMLKKYQKAKQTLNRVLVNNRRLGPESKPYYDALVERGRLESKMKAFSKSIAYLKEAMETKNKSEVVDPGVIYLLAQAYRLSITEIDADLEDTTLSPDKRIAFETRRKDSLKESGVLFGRAVIALESRGDENLSGIEKRQLRDSYFYRANASFELKDYTTAINLFDVAARRYDNDPMSLIAMIQIVNSHGELGEIQKAKVANRRVVWQRDRLGKEKINESKEFPLSYEILSQWSDMTTKLDLYGKVDDTKSAVIEE